MQQAALAETAIASTCPIAPATVDLDFSTVATSCGELNFFSFETLVWLCYILLPLCCSCKADSGAADR